MENESGVSISAAAEAAQQQEIMVVTTPLPVQSCPTKKKVFKSKEEAFEWEAHNREKYGNARQFAYQCEDCPDYHLSAMSPESFAMATSRSNYHNMPGVISTKPPAEELATRRAEVKKLRDQSVPVNQIAHRLGVSLPTIYNDLRSLDGGSSYIRSSSPVRPSTTFRDLDAVVQKRRDLEAQLFRLQQEEQRLIEMKALKIMPCWEGRGVLIQKGNERMALSPEDAKELAEKLMDYVTKA
jgi:hypothetical protein